MLPSPVSNPTTSRSSNAGLARGLRESHVQARDAAAAVVLALLRGYKLLLSPLFTGCCRYHPSCSDYMRDAVVVHGSLRGTWLGLRRLARCNPFGGHGFDPVPPRHEASPRDGFTQIGN
ncbi:MAG: membrane protein insertion efficiency factor YidD [Acidobacteria bacterium]|nr:membrane protein insertion efficiency factor YidD [Acidobacteriota bacterium]